MNCRAYLLMLGEPCGSGINFVFCEIVLKRKTFHLKEIKWAQSVSTETSSQLMYLGGKAAILPCLAWWWVSVLKTGQGNVCEVTLWPAPWPFLAEWPCASRLSSAHCYLLIPGIERFNPGPISPSALIVLVRITWYKMYDYDSFWDQIVVTRAGSSSSSTPAAPFPFLIQETQKHPAWLVEADGLARLRTLDNLPRTCEGAVPTTWGPRLQVGKGAWSFFHPTSIKIKGNQTHP